MRLWTLHPRYLDPKGLVALWREGLLAKKVLEGATRGYTRHPQLARFRALDRPQAAVCAYLREVLRESKRRGYHFDAGKLPSRNAWNGSIDVSDGQVAYEWRHLRQKLATRAPEWLARWSDVVTPEPHPIFTIVPGDVAEWERPL